MSSGYEINAAAFDACARETRNSWHYLLAAVHMGQM
jgi:hypothetical protein